jgi:DNA-binding XRE family transcriptional regulator
MTDITPSSSLATSLYLDACSPTPLPPATEVVETGLPFGLPADPFDRGRVALDATALRRLRQSRLMSQQDLADDCWRRNIRVSIATIKRAESGRAVRFRIARELARCFDVPVMRIVRA